MSAPKRGGKPWGPAGKQKGGGKSGGGNKGKPGGGKNRGPPGGQKPGGSNTRPGGDPAPAWAPRTVQSLSWPGAYQGPKGVLSENARPGRRVYGERLIPHKGKELRAWNPRRSKLAALLLASGRVPFPIKGDERLLYLGAASGTTVSHLSDILSGGRIVAVEKSPRSFRDLMDLGRARDNVDPVLSDARDPDALMAVLAGPVDLLYQDVSQRDQDRIFANMAKRFLRPGGHGVIMVKARSVSVAREPEDVYDEVTRHLQQEGMQVVDRVTLEPWERDHAAIVVTQGER